MSQNRLVARRMDMTSDVDLDLSAARRVLDRQPFSATLGTRIVTSGPDRAVLELAVRDDLRQQLGFVHGGVVSYLVDNAITFAAGPALGPDVVTGGFAVEYVRPAGAGPYPPRPPSCRRGHAGCGAL
jgi:acyl-coenzyme A thioesterase PaaI-like protein